MKNSEKINRLNSLGKSIQYTRGIIADLKKKGESEMAEEFEAELFELEYQFSEAFAE